MCVLGKITVTISYKDQIKQLPLLVVPIDGPPLLDGDWLHAITLDWKQLNRVHCVRRHKALQDALADLFAQDMGTLCGTTAKIHI